MGAAEFLMVTSGGEALTLVGAFFAAHQFGAGAGMFIMGAFTMDYGGKTVIDGLINMEAVIAEAHRRAEKESKAEFDEMQRQYSRINEWVDNDCQEHPYLSECKGEDKE